ncbi:hypothetical protein B0H13DRAFT_1890904 [Mycena leptocephala]|nr:hypothetical protein B0H13DRAFT_1890904 [Mycena leptocephala]
MYAHHAFFFDGGEEHQFALGKRFMIPSPMVGVAADLTDVVRLCAEQPAQRVRHRPPTSDSRAHHCWRTRAASQRTVFLVFPMECSTGAPSARYPRKFRKRKADLRVGLRCRSTGITNMQGLRKSADCASKRSQMDRMLDVVQEFTIKFNELIRGNRSKKLNRSKSRGYYTHVRRAATGAEESLTCTAPIPSGVGNKAWASSRTGRTIASVTTCGDCWRLLQKDPTVSRRSQQQAASENRFILVTKERCRTEEVSDMIYPREYKKRAGEEASYVVPCGEIQRERELREGAAAEYHRMRSSPIRGVQRRLMQGRRWMETKAWKVQMVVRTTEALWQDARRGIGGKFRVTST